MGGCGRCFARWRGRCLGSRYGGKGPADAGGRVTAGPAATSVFPLAANGPAPEDSVNIPTVTGLGITSPFVAVSTTPELDTWLAGGQAGCNMQSGNWVFGVEADAHAQRWSSFYTLGAGQPVPFVAGDQFGVRSDWQASVRGRVGYAMDRTLFYVTGGVAFTELQSYSNFIPVLQIGGAARSCSRARSPMTGRSHSAAPSVRASNMHGPTTSRSASRAATLGTAPSVLPPVRWRLSVPPAHRS